MSSTGVECYEIRLVHVKRTENVACACGGSRISSFKCSDAVTVPDCIVTHVIKLRVDMAYTGDSSVIRNKKLATSKDFACRQEGRQGLVCLDHSLLAGT